MGGAATEVAHGGIAILAFLAFAIVAGVTKYGPVSRNGRIAAFALVGLLLLTVYGVATAITS